MSKSVNYVAGFVEYDEWRYEGKRCALCEQRDKRVTGRYVMVSPGCTMHWQRGLYAHPACADARGWARAEDVITSEVCKPPKLPRRPARGKVT